MRKRKNSFFTWVGIFLILSALIIIGKELFEYRQCSSTYETLKEETISNEGEKKEKRKKPYTVNWERLKGADVVAWIRFKEPKQINYPVVQGKDNQYYLHRMYNKKYNYAGSIFLNSDNDPYFRNENSIIYGHNMRNRSMFGNLRKFKEKDYCKKHPYFYLYLPDGTKHTYQIFSVINAIDGTDDYLYGFADEESYLAYQNRLKKKSIFDTGVEPDITKRMVSLSTCSSIGAAKGKRVMITGMEIKVEQVQEPASWYKPPEEIPTIIE